jgi:L-fuculose-phosphate aldolase
MALTLKEQNLSPGCSGNISLLTDNDQKILITPTGLDYKLLKEEDLVLLSLDGKTVEGKHAPSSEWRFHCDLYAKRKNIKAIIHTHSIHATAVACLREEIPPLHYYVAFCGDKIPLADYHMYGTQELSNLIIEKIKEYNGLLLANHGALAVGSSLAKAYTVIEMIEFVATLYLKAKAAGPLKILTPVEIEQVRERFQQFGY